MKPARSPSISLGTNFVAQSSARESISLTNAISMDSTAVAPGDWSNARLEEPIAPSICCNAAIKYDQNRTGSLSFVSSTSQAARCSFCATHSLNNVVLPKPGGAERSMSGRVTPSSKRAMSRRRATRWGRPEGEYSFVRSKLWDTAPSNPTQKSSRGEEDRVDLLASGSRSASLCLRRLYASYLGNTTTKIQLWCVATATMTTLHSQCITKYCVIFVP
jgi:hypothetical protein